MSPKQLGRLKRRAEFLAVAGSGKKWVTPGMIIQIMPRPDSPERSYRYGLTASRKVGGAVQRNRARRRLRALAEHYLPLCTLPSADFVLIARPETVARDFSALQADLQLALSKLIRHFPAAPAPSNQPPQNGEAS